MTELASLLAGLGAGERVRGRGFERLCQWVLESAPEYAAKVDKVWLWEEWPGREGRSDTGKTLVARVLHDQVDSRRTLVLAPPRRLPLSLVVLTA